MLTKISNVCSAHMIYIQPINFFLALETEHRRQQQQKSLNKFGLIRQTVGFGIVNWERFEVCEPERWPTWKPPCVHIMAVSVHAMRMKTVRASIVRLLKWICVVKIGCNHEMKFCVKHTFFDAALNQPNAAAPQTTTTADIERQSD